MNTETPSVRLLVVREGLKGLLEYVRNDYRREEGLSIEEQAAITGLCMLERLIGEATATEELARASLVDEKRRAEERERAALMDPYSLPRHFCYKAQANVDRPWEECQHCNPMGPHSSDKSKVNAIENARERIVHKAKVITELYEAVIPYDTAISDLVDEVRELKRLEASHR